MSAAAKSGGQHRPGGGTRPAAERIQPKLQVSDRGDPLEREADAVASRVVAGEPAATVSRLTPEKKPEAVSRAAAPEKKPEAGSVQRKAGGGGDSPALASAAQHAVDSKGAGRPLEGGVRSRLESGLGADLGHVRIHDDSAARASAASLNARAFTHGSDIWMGPGESTGDLHLMAHEAAHVVQQAGGAHRLVQREDTPAAVPAVSPEEAQRDLHTFRLPPVKERHRPVYQAWAARGALKRVQGYERGEPDQKDSVWLPNVTIAQPRLDALNLPPSFTGRKNVKVHGRNLSGTYAQLMDRLKVPNWDRTGRFHPFPFEVDHVVELQVGSWPGGSEGEANQIQNMELLDKSSNASAGSRTRTAIRETVRQYLAATGQPCESGHVTSYLSSNDALFDRVEVGTGGSAANSQYWTKAEIEAGEHLTTAEPVSNEGEAGTATSFALVSGPSVLGEFAHAEGALSIAVEGEVDQRRVAGMRITAINLNGSYATAARDAPMGSVSAQLDLPPALQAAAQTLTIPLHSAGQYSGYLGELPGIGDADFPATSPIRFEAPALEGDALVIRGRLTPSIPLLGPTPIDVMVRGTELAFVYYYSAGELSLPIPGIRIDDATLGISFGTAGFHVEGGLYFSVPRLGSGSLSAGIDGEGNFEAGGSFDFDSRLFDQARIEIWYRQRAFGGRGTLRINQPGKVRGIRSLSADVTFSETAIEATGTIAPEIPGIASANLRLQYSEADGLVIGGSATLSDRVPGIRSGSLEAEVRRRPDAEEYELSAHGTAVPAIPGVSTTLNIAYDNGALTITGSAEYARGMLAGSVEIGVTNRVLDPTGQPTDDVGDALRAYGGGRLTVRLTPWLQGTVGVRLLPNGEMELTGSIGLPDVLEIFPEKRLDRNIFSINLDIPIIGFAVAGQRVGIFATIGGGLDLSAGVGPGQLRELGIGITYNPDHEDQTHIHGGARLVIPAQAGLRLFIRGALGAGIPIVSATLGLEVGGRLGLEGAVEASVDVDWTPSTGLVLDAVGEIWVEPKFRFDLTGFLDVSADLLITTINLYEKRWELAAFELGPNLRLGMRLPIHYQEGQPFDVSWDDVEFQVPDVDTDELLKGIVDQVV